MIDTGLSFTSKDCVADTIGLRKVIAFIWAFFKITEYLRVPLDDFLRAPYV